LALDILLTFSAKLRIAMAVRLVVSLLLLVLMHITEATTLKGTPVARDLLTARGCAPAPSNSIWKANTKYILKTDQTWNYTAGFFSYNTYKEQAEMHCSVNPACLAYNSDGYLIIRTSSAAPLTFYPLSAGQCVYVKDIAAPKPTTSNFLWYSNKSGWAPGTDIYASLDVCQNGNGGIRGLIFDKCMDLCLLLPTCKVVAYWPVWFGGPSACFSKGASQVPLLVGPTSNTPIVTPDQGAYFGVKR